MHCCVDALSATIAAPGLAVVAPKLLPCILHLFVCDRPAPLFLTSCHALQWRLEFRTSNIHTSVCQPARLLAPPSACVSLPVWLAWKLLAASYPTSTHDTIPATRNRTRDHLIVAVIYSQMLYQLSYSRIRPLQTMNVMTLNLISARRIARGPHRCQAPGRHTIGGAPDLGRLLRCVQPAGPHELLAGQSADPGRRPARPRRDRNIKTRSAAPPVLAGNQRCVALAPLGAGVWRPRPPARPRRHGVRQLAAGDAALPGPSQVAWC